MKKIISKTKKAEIVFQLIEEIKNAQKETVKGFLIIGRNLSKIQEEKLWSYYGSHIENFDSFLREIKIKRATAYNLMAIWRNFGEIIISKNLDVSYFRLVKLLPIVKKEKNKEDWLFRAQELDPQGFENEIREALGKIPTDKCEHNGEKIYLVKCMICGKIIKVEPKQLLNELKKI